MIFHLQCADKKEQSEIAAMLMSESEQEGLDAVIISHPDNSVSYEVKDR